MSVYGVGWQREAHPGAGQGEGGVAALVLLAVRGALYSIGAVFYGLRWPDPWPSTFGYHELFHACTAVAAMCPYIAIWFVVF